MELESGGLTSTLQVPGTYVGVNLSGVRIHWMVSVWGEYLSMALLSVQNAEKVFFKTTSANYP